MPRRTLAPTLLSSTAQLPVAEPATSVVGAGPQSAPARRRSITPGRLYAVLAAVVLALGALSLLAPSTPSYDPWSWTLWARQIIHGHLTITDTGTSWKPLPMLATIPFALFGGAAPDLWLAVARAGAIAAVLMAFRLAHRLTRELALGRTGAGPRTVSVQGPAILAGLIAITALGFAAKGGYITSNGLGYSEGLAAALLLVAIECHLDGRWRAAFAVGFLVALDRPEIWLFWVPYGLWLGRRDARVRPAILAAFALQPLAWFLPVYLGSGHLGSSVTRAQHPRANSLAYTSSPFWSELSRAAWPTMMLRIKIVALLLIGGAPAAAWWQARRRGRSGLPRELPRGLVAAAVLGVGGIAWFVLVALMTQLGFSGNDRYLVLGAALVDICGAVGIGWLAIELAQAAGRVGRAGARRGAAGRPGRGAGRRSASVGTALAAVAFALLPGWIATQDFVALPKVHGALLYQAHLRQSLATAIARVGGPSRALECGSVMTEGFQVPMVAYALHVATPRVLAAPDLGAVPGPAPNVILQTRATRSSTQLPVVRDWRPASYTYRGGVGPWHTFTRCATGPQTR